MYNLPYFRENNREEVLNFMQHHPFITLCGSDAGNKPVVTQIPVLIKEAEGKILLEGHFMKNTDHHNAFVHNPEALAIFTGPHTYISASWYANKQVASTWNYMSVHARGKIKFLSAGSLLRILSETTSVFEKDPASPASFDHLPEEYVAKLSKAIIGFEICVEQLENIFKLSQNENPENQQSIIKHLRTKDANGIKIAEEMDRYITTHNRLQVENTL